MKCYNYTNNVNLIIRIKSFLGLYALTPFENELIKLLKESLSKENAAIFEEQLKFINSTERFLESVENPLSYGWTFFRKMRFNKPQSHFTRPFPEMSLSSNKGVIIGKTKVTFNKGEINVTFKSVHGIFCSIEYRSPDKIYYPPKEYSIEEIKLFI